MKILNWFRGPAIAMVLMVTCIQTALAQVDSAACSSLTDSLLLGAGNLPDVAADPLGYIHIVWADSTNGVMYEQVGPDGVITVPPTSVYPAAAGAGYSIPHVAVDKYGNAHVVAGLSIGQILYLKISGGKQVAINVFLINTDGWPNQADYSPCIAINPTTQLPVVAAEVHTDYYAYLYGLYVYSTYIASVSLDGGGNPVPGSVFDAWYDMETPNYLFNRVSYPSVAVDTNGVTHVVWEYQDPTVSGLTVGYANSKLSYFEVIANTPNVSGFVGRPVIIRGADGNLDVVWSTSGNAVVWTQLNPQGFTMVNNSIVSQPAAIPSWPNLASASGQLVCSWTDRRNGANSQVFARSLLSAVPECDVSESPGAASFGAVVINYFTNSAYVWQDQRSNSSQLWFRATSQEGGSVSGTVLDGNSGKELAGATVQLGTYNTVSDIRGAYSFSSVAVGTYTLTGSKPGYSAASYLLTVNAGSSLSETITLLPTNSECSVSGTVLDGNSGNLLAGATVQLGTYITESDSGGAYNFSSVAAGAYTLTGSKPGYSAASYPLTVTAGSSLSQTISLLPTHSTISVTSVKSQFADSSYYLNGVEFQVSFTANVDWAGHPPGTVQFITPRKTYAPTATGSVATQVLDMGNDFGPGGALQVVATSSDRATSARVLAKFTVMPNFLDFSPVWKEEADGNTFKYSCTINPTFFIKGTTAIPGNIPVFGFDPLTLTWLPEADLEIDSDGSAKVTIHGLDFATSKTLGKAKPNPAYLTYLMRKLISSGYNNALLPRASYGGIDVDFYPLLGGGWQYNASTSQWQYNDAFGGLGGNFTAQKTWPFVVGIIPLFAKAKFDISAEITDQLNVNQTLVGALDLAPDLTGSLGAGVSDVLSVSVWLKGSANLNLQWPQLPTLYPYPTASISVGASAYALLWHWDYNGFTWQWTYNSVTGVWSLNSSGGKAQMHSFRANGEPRPLNRDYLNFQPTGAFAPVLSSNPKPELFGIGGSGTNLEVLLTPAMPYSEPNCTSSGTNLYLVFLEDDTNRTAMNRTIAMFSSFNGILWSMPVALADDGTADFHPRILTFSNGSAVAAWENEQAVLPDTVSYAGMESNLEISVAWYNPSAGWRTAQSLTTNNYISHSPKLAANSPNHVLVTWISNSANDATGSTVAPNQIWSAEWNGSAWATPQLAGTVSNTIVKYDLAYNGTNANLVMSVDTVDNSTNADGHELFVLACTNGNWGNLTQLTFDAVPDDNPQLAVDPSGNLVLTWLKGGALSSAINLNLTDAQVILTNDYSSNLADFKLANNGEGKLALIWPEPSDNDSDLFAVFYDPIFNTWGSPRQMTDDPQTERSPTAAFYGTNELVAVFNRTIISSTNDLDTTPVDLVAFYHTLDEDLALDSGSLTATPANPTPGSTATLTVNVLNLGDQVETNVVVAFYWGAVQPGSLIGEITLTNALPPQGTNSVTFSWQVPITNSPVTVFAVVDPNATVPESNFSNNIAQITVMDPNTEIKAMTWSRVASNLLAVTVTVINDGVINNTPTTISLNQDSATGTNLFNQTIGALAPGQSTEVTFLWNTTGLPDNLNVYAFLSGSGLSYNFSTNSIDRSLAVSQVPPPWIANYQLTNNCFQVAFFGTLDRPYTLLASTNLIEWTSVLNFTCTNAPMSVMDTDAQYFGWRYYRIAQVTKPQ